MAEPVVPVESAAPGAPEPITGAEIRGSLILMGFFVACMALAAILAAPYKSAGLTAFEDPNDGSNVLVYGLLIGLFTFAILYIAKKGKKWLIRAIILGAVGMTLLYALYPVLGNTSLLPHVCVGGPADNPCLGGFELVGLSLAVLLAGLSIWGLLRHPEWYVIDAVGLLVAAASAAIFGISLNVLWVVVLLAGLAVYDAIAVYRTKHMLSLADAVIELRLPVLLVIPKHWGYSFLSQAAAMKEASPENKGKREAMFMGLGDLVMPTILVVSATQFAPASWGLISLLGAPLSIPALGAAIGTLAGYTILMGFVLRGNPQAGLPLLNGGAILGFLLALMAQTGSIRFW